MSSAAETGDGIPVNSRLHAPVAQWIEQPPPKGQVGRSIRLRGAKYFVATRPKLGLPVSKWD
jgi:hypothetical protein